MFGRSKPFVPYISTDEELTALFHASDMFPETKHSPYRYLVVPVLLRLLFCCGLRPGEARNLRCSDFDLASGILHIKETKQHKDRTVPVAPDMLELCRKYHSLISLTYTNREYSSKVQMVVLILKAGCRDKWHKNTPEMAGGREGTTDISSLSQCLYGAL